MESTAYIKLAIADDHELFRDGVAMMLKQFPDIEVVGQAENGKELIEIVNQHSPDIVLTDISMPVMDGIEVTRFLSKSNPAIGIICLSMFDEDNLIIDMLEAGAKGYLLKNADKLEIAEAIKTVYNQQPYYCRRTTVKLAAMIAASKFNPYKHFAKPDFTDREVEIISLICKELTNKEIADTLFLSIRTVEGYRLKILEKMNVKNSIGLVIYAIRNNLYAI
jgi:two-component system, NarL family, response regulator NreC